MRLRFIPARHLDVKYQRDNGYYLLRLEHDVYRVEVDGDIHPTLFVHPLVTFPRQDAPNVGWVGTCSISGRLVSGLGPTHTWSTRHQAARAALAWVEGPVYEVWAKEREIWELERVDYVSCGVSSTGWRRPADGLRHGDEFERM